MISPNGDGLCEYEAQAVSIRVNIHEIKIVVQGQNRCNRENLIKWDKCSVGYSFWFALTAENSRHYIYLLAK